MNIFIDIETCPDQSEGALSRCITNVQAPGQYKKPESIAEWKASNAQSVGTEQWLKSALDPMSGGILVICWAREDAMVSAHYRDPAEPEATLLQDWATAMGHAINESPGQRRFPKFVGWNVAEFDLRYLAIRCAIHKVALPFALPVNARPDGTQVCDLMKVWSGYRGYEKQSEVARVLGIPLEDDTDGADLWDLVRTEGIQAAVTKCKSDISALRAIHQRMQPIFGC